MKILECSVYYDFEFDENIVFPKNVIDSLKEQNQEVKNIYPGMWLEEVFVDKDIILDMSNSEKDSEFERRTLQDAGIGYYTNYKNAFTKLQIARVIGSEDIQTENVGNISRVLFQAGLTF